jgi:hypothetical protein
MPVAAAPDPVKVAVRACTAPDDAQSEELLMRFGWEKLDVAGSLGMARTEAEAAAISTLIILTEDQVRDLVEKLVAAHEASPADAAITEDGGKLHRFINPETPGLLLQMVPGDAPGARACTIAIPRSVSTGGFLSSLRLIPELRPEIGARTKSVTRDGADLMNYVYLPMDIPSIVREDGKTRAGPVRGTAEIKLFTLTEAALSDTQPPFNTRASLSISFTPTGD